MASVSKSVLNKWRCLVALAHIDNKFTDEERNFITSKLDSPDGPDLSEEQRKIVEADFDNPKKPEDFFDQIDEGLEKIDLLKLSYELFWCDDEYADEEVKAFENIKQSLSDSYNFNKLFLDDLVKFRGRMIKLENIINKGRV
mgnify:CR=1 FL=1